MDSSDRSATIYFTRELETTFQEHLVATKAVALGLADTELHAVPEQLLSQYDTLSSAIERVGSFHLPFDPEDYNKLDKNSIARPFSCSLAELALIGGGLQLFYESTDAELSIIPHTSATRRIDSVARRIEGRLAGTMAAIVATQVELTPLVVPKPRIPFGFTNVKWFNAQ